MEAAAEFLLDDRIVSRIGIRLHLQAFVPGLMFKLERLFTQGLELPGTLLNLVFQPAEQLVQNRLFCFDFIFTLWVEHFALAFRS